MIDFKKELNAAQYEVVTKGDGPSLILAGAGSGKTRTLVYRVAYLLQQGIPAEKILLLTFTNKAAHEMLARVDQLVGDPAKTKKLWGGTFHHIANRLLRTLGPAAGLPRNFTILDREDSKDLLKRIIKEATANNQGQRLPQPGFFMEVISYATNAQVPLAESLSLKYPEGLRWLTLFETVAARYAERKTRAHALDFDDLLLGWWRLLQTPKLKSKLQNFWQYVLVDEYQDTNVVQDAIVKELAAKHRNLLVVGDDAQSIYSFRAANIENILSFPRAFPDAKIFKLEENYRSSPEILQVANDVIAKNTAQYAKKLFTEGPPFVKPEVWAHDDPAGEAQAVADRLIMLEDEGVDLRQMAVLFRAAHESQALELELNRRRIPYELRGGLRFFERAHIKDVLSLLKLLVNPQDETAWYRTLLLHEGIGFATAEKIIELVLPINDWTGILSLQPRISAAASRGWRDLMKLMGAAYEARLQGPAAVIKRSLKYYGDYLRLKYTDYQERLEDIQQLALFADGYDSLENFLAETSLQEAYALRPDVSRARERGVVLSTVHQAKGLEWHTVFVIDLTSNTFPHPRAVREGGLEEERRLFYVAITRAQRRLYLSYPITASQYNMGLNQPSQFLRELDSRLLAGDVPSDDDTILVDDSGERAFLPPISRL